MKTAVYSDSGPSLWGDIDDNGDNFNQKMGTDMLLHILHGCGKDVEEERATLEVLADPSGTTICATSKKPTTIVAPCVLEPFVPTIAIMTDKQEDEIVNICRKAIEVRVSPDLQDQSELLNSSISRVIKRSSKEKYGTSPLSGTSTLVKSGAELDMIWCFIPMYIPHVVRRS